jgi:UDP-N-acetylmuramyl tripeptide synthase
MFRARVIWFSLDERHPQIQEGLERAGEAWVLSQGSLTRLRRGASGVVAEPLLRADEAPLTTGGAALYNVANALGVCAAAGGLGVSDAALAAGLRSFLPGRDNPGRANFFDVAGVRVLVDFGHNAHAVQQLGLMLGKLRAPGAGLAVISGCAGDRSDKNLRELAAAIAAMRPTRVLLRDLPGYLRGRQPGEVPGLLTRALIDLGLAPGAVATLESEVACLRAALDSSLPGDLVALLVHLDSDEVDAELRARGARRVE